MVFTQGMYRYRCTHPYSFVVFCLKIYLWRKPKTITSRDWISVIHIFVEPRYLDYKALKKVMKTGEGEAGSLCTKNRWCDVKMGPERVFVCVCVPWTDHQHQPVTAINWMYLCRAASLCRGFYDWDRNWAQYARSSPRMIRVSYLEDHPS